MEALGLESERFRLIWCSSAEADRFVAAIREMTEMVKAMGPSPYRRDSVDMQDQQEVRACRSK